MQLEPGTVRVAEFFAGVGLVRMALERVGMSVVWSNDIEPAKQSMYLAHFGSSSDHEYRLGDVGIVRAHELPGNLALAWASFPCTDLSLAGARRGLAGNKSGTFFGFRDVLRDLDPSDRPPVVALENVVGLATSNRGEDLRVAVRELNALGYSVDVITLDARRFVPQSRPRLFLIGTTTPPTTTSGVSSLRPDWLQFIFGDSSLRTHQAVLPEPPPPRFEGLGAFVDDVPSQDSSWWTGDRLRSFLASLSDIQRRRLNVLVLSDTPIYRTAYRRTRHGAPVWEVRADGLSGCLRTASGGSSKQAVVRCHNGSVDVRWMTASEYGKLMGAGEFRFDGMRTLQAMFGFGDAVCVPVVEWIARNYLVDLVAPKSLAYA